MTLGLNEAQIAARMERGEVNTTTAAVGRTNLDIIKANVFTRDRKSVV